MKRTLMLAIVVGTMMWPASAFAQEAPGSFQQLRNAGRLDTGDSFFVTRTDGTRIKGKLEDVRDGILRLRVHGRSIEFTENDVSRIERRDTTEDGMWLGVLIGAGTLTAYSAT